MTNNNMCVDSCFDCKLFKLCYLRIGIEDQLRKGVNLLNINGNDRPGRYVDIFRAIGSSCMEFRREES